MKVVCVFGISKMTIGKRADVTKKIHIKIHKPDNSYLKCIIKINTPIKKLMRVYCLRARVSSVRFRYDGIEMLGTDTPLTHELEDGDIIDAHDC